MTDIPANTAESRGVRVWDLPTRMFHWLLALSILFGWVSYEFSEAIGDPGLVYHRYNGYFVVVLVIWRILWGLGGPASVRFASFLRSPKTVLAYTANLFRGQDRPYLGHNPLGGYAVLALLLAAGFQATLGLFSEEEYTVWGPLSHIPGAALKEQITELHQSFFNVIIALVVLHVLANLYHGLFKREPLIKAMVTGAKPEGDYADADTAPKSQPIATIVTAIILFAVSVGIFVAAIKILGGRVIY